MTKKGDDNLRDRLSRALPAAMRARDRPAMTALRSAVAAIDNAGAVDPTHPLPTDQDPRIATSAARPQASPGPGSRPQASLGSGSRPPESVDRGTRPAVVTDTGSRPPKSTAPGSRRPSSGAGTRSPESPGPGTGQSASTGPEAGHSDLGAARAAHPELAGTVAGVGATEVERRSLSQAQMEAIVRVEIADRETAAAGYERAGQLARAERLRAEAKVLLSHLDTT
jgi:uncharacterized protein YqeY